MEWTITLHQAEQYAEVVTSGPADTSGTLEMVKAIAATLKPARITNILIDHTNISSVSGGVGEVYFRPQKIKGSGIPRGTKIAEIIRPEHKEFFDFLETVSTNRGLKFSIFLDRASALEWLLK